MLFLSCFRLLFLDPACSSISITQHAVLYPLTLTCFKAFRCYAGKQPGCGIWAVMHKAAAISTYDAATPCTLAAIGTGHLSSMPASGGMVRCAIPHQGVLWPGPGILGGNCLMSGGKCLMSAG